MNHDTRDGGHPDKPRHLHSLADVARVAAQLQREASTELRQIGLDLAFLLERAQVDLDRVLDRARAGALMGVPPNLARWPSEEAIAYLEQHLDLLARVNADDPHLAALLRRRPELYARATAWLEVARRHYERDHPGSADPADQPADGPAGRA